MPSVDYSVRMALREYRMRTGREPRNFAIHPDDLPQLRHTYRNPTHFNTYVFDGMRVYGVPIYVTERAERLNLEMPPPMRPERETSIFQDLWDNA